MDTQFKRKRIGIAMSCMLVMLMIGIIYTWSVFSVPLENDLGWARTETSFIYSLCLILQWGGSFSASILAKKINRPVVVVISGILMIIGFVMTGRASALWEMYIFFSLFCGFGIGLCYNSILSTIVTWFPEKSGFITGFVLMFYGLSSMILSPLAAMLIENVGWRQTFIILGIAVSAVVLVFSFQVRPFSGEPPAELFRKSTDMDNSLESENNFKPTEMLKSKSFWFFFVWSLCNAVIALGLSGHAAMLADAASVTGTKIAFCVGIVSLCNGFGRLIFGSLYDNRGRLFTMLAINFAAITGSVCLYLSISNQISPLLVAGFVLLGITFGGAAVTGPNFARGFYGRLYYGTNINIANLPPLLASFFGPMVAALLYENSGYPAVALMFISLSIIGVIANLLIRRP